jgi:hypothetical protein
MVDRFDKFTERARRVFSLAQEEAQRFNHNYIGTEHILLVLVREGDGVAARVLSNLGVQLPQVRVAVEARIGRSETMIMGEIGLTQRAKKVVELSVDEARRLNHHYIGTEHVLLGLVREGEGIAAQVLRGLGVELDRVRAQVIAALSRQSVSTIGPLAPDVPPAFRELTRELQQVRDNLADAITAQDFDLATALVEVERQIKERIGELVKAWQRERPERSWQSAEPTPARVAPFTPEAQQVMALARGEAQRFDHIYIGTEHLLLGLLRLDSSVVTLVLANLRVETPRVRSAVEFIIGRGETMIMGEIGLTPRAKKVVELATDEARRLNHHAIAPEHLLLGLIREGEGIAAGVLLSLGVQLDKARAQVIQQLIQTPGAYPEPPVLRTMPSRSVPTREPLGEFVDVLPIAVRVEQGTTAITLLALERYSNGFLATFRLVVIGRHHLPTEFSVTGEDDGGQRYTAGLYTNSGAGGLDHFEQRFAYRFTPPVDPAANVLTITLAAGRRTRSRADLTGQSPPALWTFTIPLPSTDRPAS